MPVLADLVDTVIGVDPHKHTHTAVIVAAATGKKLASPDIARALDLSRVSAGTSRSARR